MNSTVIYVRSSTNNRTDIDKQIENCTKFAQENMMVVIETYVDTNKFYLERKNLIQDCKSQKVRNVIVYSMDRLSRNIEDLQILTKTFEDNAVNIFLCREEDMNSFQLGILKAMTNFETQIREERELIDSPLSKNFFPHNFNFEIISRHR